MEQNNLKVLVVSSKGGVGKSTIAMQVIVPYLYRQNNNNLIDFFEFDDEYTSYKTDLPTTPNPKIPTLLYIYTTSDENKHSF